MPTHQSKMKSAGWVQPNTALPLNAPLGLAGKEAVRRKWNLQPTSLENGFDARPHLCPLTREKEQRLSVFCFANGRPANPAAGFSKDASTCSDSYIFWWLSFGGCHLAFSLQICVNS
jgi:hypothetical protein